jgi:hypothetical protein
VAEFELDPSRVLVRSWGGCGVQFNQHVYAAITGVPEEKFADLHDKVVTLAPQLVRLFYNDKHEGDPSDNDQSPVQKDKWNSFVRAVALAQQVGATINVTWQSGALVTSRERETSMRRFADVLDKLVTTSGITNLRWVTLQNEPNTPPRKGEVKAVTPQRLGEMYRRLDQRLTDKGIRRQIRFMGGDLIEGSRDPKNEANQKRWFVHMSDHLADILDAYSIHVYWNYDDVGRFRQRLQDVEQIVRGLANPKPVYITECGTRAKGHSPTNDPGNFKDGTPLAKTNVVAFQHAWFQILAAQLGYAGTIKWDGYYGKYDRGTQAYYAIGPPEPDGWQLYPMYFLLRLITTTTEAGWQVVNIQQSASSERTKHLTAFVGAAGELTILGLDSRGAMLNSASKTRISYAIGGLPSRASLALVLWNRAGGGQLVVDSTIAADADGVARITVPLHSVFALTTKSLPPA